MKPAEFIRENLGVIANASNGLLRLREIVLSRAIHGTLVASQPGDGDSAKQVAALRTLLSARRIENKTPGTIYKESPWPLPSNWVWSRLDEIGVIAPTNVLDDSMAVSFVPMSAVPAGFSGHISSTEDRPWKSIRSQYTHLADGDVALAKITPCFQNRKSVVVGGLVGGVGAGTTELHVFRPADPTLIDPRFVLLWLKSPEFINRGVSLMTGTAGQQRVPRDYFSASPFPFPPFDEQKRIVAKVDHLMSMLDDLEQRQEKRRVAAVHVSKACLDSLVKAEDHAQLASAWERVSSNFGVVAGSEGAPEQLRRATINLAVRARLVDRRQCGAGDASDLVNELNLERQRLYLANKAQRPKPRIGVQPNEMPYGLPDHWVWCRVEDLCTHIVDCLHTTPNHDERGGYPSIRTSEIMPGRLLVDAALRVDRATYEERIARLPPMAGDIIYAREGGRFGVAATVPPSTELCLGQRTMMFRVASGVEPDYFMWAFNSDTILNQAKATVGGSASPHVNIRAIRHFVFPLPPSGEQKLIVAKIKYLMGLIDDAEHRSTALVRAASNLAMWSAEVLV